MTPIRLLPLLAAGAALAVAGCGGDDSSSSSSGSTGSTDAAPATSTAAAAPAPSGNTVQIDMKNLKFDPAEQTVKVGQTVKWVNQEPIPHNVIGGPLKSSTFSKGGSYTFKATKPQTIAYVCTIHPGMDGKLIVER